MKYLHQEITNGIFAPKKTPLLIVMVLICFYLIVMPRKLVKEPKIISQSQPSTEIKLPGPAYTSKSSIEEVLKTSFSKTV